MKTSHVIGGIELAMRAMAKKRGVTLHIGGSQACTNGKEIYIPTLPDDTRAMKTKACGYVDHEGAHVSLTDFSIPMDDWTNILEDVRIEKEQGLEYPGAAVNFKNLVALLVEEGKLRAEEDDPAGMLMIWALSRLRHNILRQDAIAVREAEAETYCRKAFGKKFSDKFVAIADKVDKARCTADCKKLAEEIEKLINQSARAAQQSGQSNDESPQDSSQQSGSGKGNDQPGKQHDQADEPDNDPGQPDQKPGDNGQSKGSQQKHDQDEGKTQNSDQKPSESDEADQEDDQSGNAGQPDDNGQSEGSRKPERSQQENDQQGGQDQESDKPGETRQDPSQTGNPGQEHGTAGKSAQGSSQAGKSRQKDQTGNKGQDSGQTTESDDSEGTGAGSQPEGLRTLPDAKPRVETDLGKILKVQLDIEGRKASGSMVVPVASVTHERRLPDRSCLAFQGFKDETDTALRISGKMRSQLLGLFQAKFRKKGYAVQNGYSLNRKTLHLVAVSTPDNRVFNARQERKQEDTAIAIMLDSSYSMRDSDNIQLALNATFATAKYIEMMNGVTCTVGAFQGNDDPSILEVKAFNVKPDLRRFYCVRADGGTPMAEAILWGGQQLTLRRENRKMIILFTDGEPNSENNARDAVKRVTKYGIELYVIALGPNPNYCLAQVTQWVDESLVSPITRIEDLGGAFIKLLRKTLVSQRVA